MTNSVRMMSLALAAAASMVQANAAVIPTLFNTGVGSSGLLSDGTLGDPHYTLTSVPGGSTTGIRVRTSDGGWPITPWIGDNTLSRWIGPNNRPDLNGPGGTYVFHTTFDLTGFSSGASISGRWSTDNQGMKILINGADAGVAPTSSPLNVDKGDYRSWFSFNISSGFSYGQVNTLDFYVNNIPGPANNPAGLRVEMVGTATAVPEPSTYFAGISALGMLCLLGKRNRK